MLRKSILATALVALFTGLSHAAPGEYGAAAAVVESAPVAKGHYWTREVMDAMRIQNHANPARVSNSPNMTYHGGNIMPTAITTNIFWGTSWAGYSGDKITGLDSWYAGYGSSNYSATVTEYTGSNGTVGLGTSHTGHVIDTSPAAGGGNTAAILAEVCKAIPSPDVNGNGYYAVYTDLPRGSAGYCAWHASGMCGATTVQFAFFWKLDGDTGCDPGDTSGLHSQGLAALANVTGHELSEARTDPSTTTSTGSPGWYDSKGAENGDKCAWTFNTPLVRFTNNIQWKLQGEWSNKAYTAGTGYANSSGQKGCVSGL